MNNNMLESLKAGLKKLTENSRLMRLCLASALYITAILVLIAADMPGISKIEVGKPAPYDIKASHSVKATDQEMWERAKEQAAADVRPIEKINDQALEISQNKIKKTFEIIRSAKRKKDGGKSTFTEEEISDISQDIPINLSDPSVKALLNSHISVLEQIYTNSTHILGIVMQQGISDNEQDKAKESIRKEAEQLPGISMQNIKICTETAQAALIPNKFIDIKATQEAKQEAKDKTPEVTKNILSGQIIVREGDIVKESDIPVLEALGIYKPKLTAGAMLSACGLVFVMLLISRLYMKRYTPSIYLNLRLLSGIIILCVLFIILSRYTIAYSIYFIPIAFPAILISILIDSRLAVLLVSILSAYIGIMTSSFASTASVIFTGLTSVMSVHKIQRRWDIVIASIWISLINIFSIAAFSFAGNENIEKMVLTTIFYGSLNGFIPALLASGFLPILENILKVTTHIKMLELSNPSEPALRDLLNKAPGTYMHSIMVANLAEAAAQAIGADSMLCRTGSLYHDIGKMKQPNMFVENQLGENPHDKLPPSLSAMIVISHVTFGKELAKKYKLPPEISKFIYEHHGTNLASFFFHKAKQNSDEPVFAEDFMYSGPSPQSKETAIVMICDGCEAAARTLRIPNKENLSSLIDKIVSGIIKNKQLDECPISLREISEVKASVLRSLTSHYHSRVAYPSEKKSK